MNRNNHFNKTLFMKKLVLLTTIAMSLVLTACNQGPKKETPQQDFRFLLEQFADLKIMRYQVPGFDELTTNDNAGQRQSNNSNNQPDGASSDARLRASQKFGTVNRNVIVKHGDENCNQGRGEVEMS